MRVPSDADIVDMLHDAFVTADQQPAARETLLGTIGSIESHVEGRVLMLGGAKGHEFYAVPLDLDKLRDAIIAMASAT